MSAVRASRYVSAVALSVNVTALVGGCADGGDMSGPGPVPRSVRAQDDPLKSAESALVRWCLTERRVPARPDGGYGQGRAVEPQLEFPACATRQADLDGEGGQGAGQPHQGGRPYQFSGA